MHTTCDTRAPRGARTSSMSHPPKMAMSERHWQPTAAAVQRRVQLAGAALLDALTREQVITALIGRISRDEHSLAYRKARRKHTSYDDQVEADLPAMARAVGWREDASINGRPRSAHRVAAAAAPSTSASRSRADGSVRR